MTFTRDIVINYGADATGVADSSTAFLNFQTDAKAQPDPAVLTVPPGTYKNPTAAAFFQGIADLTINATGATIQYFSAPGPEYQTANTSARLSDARIRQTTVTLQTAGQTSFFTSGKMVVVSSDEMQGSGGYPANWANFEFRRIVSIGAGTLTFDAPLQNTYRTGFPATTSGVYETGGPATVFTLKPEWDQKVTVNGGTLDNIVGQVQITAREFYLNNVTINGTVGTDGFAPSFSKNIVCTNCTFLRGAEVDKNIENITFNSCTSIGQVTLQNRSVSQHSIHGGTFGTINGTTPRTITIDSGAVITTLALGSNGYGVGVDLSIQDSHVGTLTTLLITNYVDLTDPDIVYSGGGVFSVLNSTGKANVFWRFAVPGSVAFFFGTGAGGAPNWGNPFTITNIWADATTTYFSTTYAGDALPNYTPGLTLTKLVLHPQQNITVRNSTGDDAIGDLNQAPAGKPLYTYTNRTYSGNIASTPTFYNQWGKVVSIKINVTKAFTGTGALGFNFFGQFGAAVFSDTNVKTFWNPSIDLRTPGPRTIRLSGVTGGGGADSIPALPSNAWVARGATPIASADIGGQDPSTYPTVTLEFTTDQGLLALAAPLGMRLHA